MTTVTKDASTPKAPPPPLTRDPNGGFCGPQMARRHNRPPTWRWDYACTLVRCDKKPLDDDDAWVRRAFDLRRYQLGVPGVPKPASGLAAAYELYTTTEPFRRWVVEARFVAKQTVREVAAVTGVTQVALKAYEKLFFDVAGPNGDYPAVRINVILPLQVRDVGRVDVERALKVFAFKGGPHVLDRAIEYFTTAPRPRRSGPTSSTPTRSSGGTGGWWCNWRSRSSACRRRRSRRWSPSSTWSTASRRDWLRWADWAL